MKIISANLGGNWHDAADLVNSIGWAGYLFAICPPTGVHTVVIFRVPDDVAYDDLKNAMSKYFAAKLKEEG